MWFTKFAKFVWRVPPVQASPVQHIQSLQSTESPFRRHDNPRQTGSPGGAFHLVGSHHAAAVDLQYKFVDLASSGLNLSKFSISDYFPSYAISALRCDTHELLQWITVDDKGGADYDSGYGDGIAVPIHDGDDEEDDPRKLKDYWYVIVKGFRRVWNPELSRWEWVGSIKLGDGNSFGAYGRAQPTAIIRCQPYIKSIRDAGENTGKYLERQCLKKRVKSLRRGEWYDIVVRTKKEADKVMRDLDATFQGRKTLKELTTQFNSALDQVEVRKPPPMEVIMNGLTIDE